MRMSYELRKIAPNCKQKVQKEGVGNLSQLADFPGLAPTPARFDKVGRAASRNLPRRPLSGRAQLTYLLTSGAANS